MNIDVHLGIGLLFFDHRAAAARGAELVDNRVLGFQRDEMIVGELRARYGRRDREAVARLQVLAPVDFGYRRVQLGLVRRGKSCKLAKYPIGKTRVQTNAIGTVERPADLDAAVYLFRTRGGVSQQLAQFVEQQGLETPRAGDKKLKVLHLGEYRVTARA